MGVSNLSFLEGILEVPGKSQLSGIFADKIVTWYIHGCPKCSFLYFISLYFSTIGLGKQIIEKQICLSV